MAERINEEGRRLFYAANVSVQFEGRTISHGGYAPFSRRDFSALGDIVQENFSHTSVEDGV